MNHNDYGEYEINVTEKKNALYTYYINHTIRYTNCPILQILVRTLTHTNT
jgi:hypothetical protein